MGVFFEFSPTRPALALASVAIMALIVVAKPAAVVPNIETGN